MCAAFPGGGPAGLCSAVGDIDTAAGQTARTPQSVRGCVVQSPFSACIRNEVGIPAAAGDGYRLDHGESLLVAGRAELGRFRRHLAAADATPSAVARAAPATQEV